MKSMNSENETEKSASTDYEYLTCPHCGFEHHRPDAPDEHYHGTQECSECGKSFFWTKHILVSFFDEQGMTIEIDDESAMGGEGKWVTLRGIECASESSWDAYKKAKEWCREAGVDPVGIGAGCGEDGIGWALIVVKESSFEYAE